MEQRAYAKVIVDTRRNIKKGHEIPGRVGGLGEVSSYDTNAEGDDVCGRTYVDSSAKHKTETEPTVIGSTIKKDN